MGKSGAELSHEDVLAGTSYEIVDQVGHGGFAVVYRVRHRVLDVAPRAAKVLRDIHRDDEAAVQRLDQEAYLLSRFRHPNLVQVYEQGTTTNGNRYFIMEFVEGLDLQQRIKKFGRLRLNEAMHVMQAVLGVLSTIHASGVIHRDVKAANILLANVAGRTTVKVLDLGIAKAENSESRWQIRTTEGAMLGTLAYMSPEQARGEPCDARTDIYACGVLLHYMLAAYRPFSDRSHVELLQAILNEVPTPLHEIEGLNVPLEISRVITRALAKDREDRFASADDMLTELFRAVQDDDEKTRVGPQSRGKRQDTGTMPLNAAQFKDMPFPRSSRPGAKTEPLLAVPTTPQRPSPVKAAPSSRGSRGSLPGVAVPPMPYTPRPPAVLGPVLITDSVDSAEESPWGIVTPAPERDGPISLRHPQLITPPPVSSSVPELQSCKAPPTSSPLVVSVRPPPLLSAVTDMGVEQTISRLPLPVIVVLLTLFVGGIAVTLMFARSLWFVALALLAGSLFALAAYRYFARVRG